MPLKVDDKVRSGDGREGVVLSLNPSRGSAVVRVNQDGPGLLFSTFPYDTLTLIEAFTAIPDESGLN